MIRRCQFSGPTYFYTVLILAFVFAFKTDLAQAVVKKDCAPSFEKAFGIKDPLAEINRIIKE